MRLAGTNIHVHSRATCWCVRRVLVGGIVPMPALDFRASLKPAVREKKITRAFYAAPCFPSCQFQADPPMYAILVTRFLRKRFEE